MYVKRAITHFLEFHKGGINIFLHVIGFAGIFYSVWKLEWILFTISLVIVEAGHFYNHFIGFKKYEGSLKVNFFRLIVFLAVIIAFYYGSKLFAK